MSPSRFYFGYYAGSGMSNMPMINGIVRFFELENI